MSMKWKGPLVTRLIAVHPMQTRMVCDSCYARDSVVWIGTGERGLHLCAKCLAALKKDLEKVTT